jgi:hypothetical protein
VELTAIFVCALLLVASADAVIRRIGPGHPVEGGPAPPPLPALSRKRG